MELTVADQISAEIFWFLYFTEKADEKWGPKEKVQWHVKPYNALRQFADSQIFLCWIFHTCAALPSIDGCRPVCPLPCLKPTALPLPPPGLWTWEEEAKHAKRSNIRELTLLNAIRNINTWSIAPPMDALLYMQPLRPNEDQWGGIHSWKTGGESFFLLLFIYLNSRVSNTAVCNGLHLTLLPRAWLFFSAVLFLLRVATKTECFG